MALLESGNAVTITTGAIVDSSGAIWTLVPSTANGMQIALNGKVQTTTANVTLLLYWNRRVYQQNQAGGWWYYAASAWVTTSDPRSKNPVTPTPTPTPTPAAVESKNGATISSSTGSLVDSSANIWTLVSSATSGLQIARNGTVDTATANVTLLLYSNKVIYQQNSAGGWWSWSSNAWQSTGDPRGAASVPTAVPPTPTPSAGTGPGSSGSLLSVDFANLTGKTAPATLWGIAAAAPNDYHFAMCNDNAFLAAAAQIMPAMYRINSNSGGNGYWSDQVFANGVNNPDWSVIAPFINNGYKFISSTCRLTVGVRINALSVSDYAIACKQMANHFRNTPGGNGKPLTVWGWEVGNEDNGTTDINTYCQYFNAAADAYHSIDPNYKIIGTVDSFVDTGRLSAFAQQCGSKVGAVCYHDYAYCKGIDPVPSNQQLFASPRPSNDAVAARNAVNGRIPSTVPIMMGEYNMDCNAQNETRQQGILGPVFAATWMLNGFNANVGVEMGCIWEMANDGAYGIIQNGRIDPTGYFLSKAGAVMGGKEVRTSFGKSGSHVCLAIQDGGRIGIMIVNYDEGSPITGTVGLSHWPVNNTGNGMINAWELSSANPQGKLSSVTVGNGMTSTVTVPATGIVILYN
jgi:hypothetical protein